MLEGPLVIATLVRALRFERVPGEDPVPVAHLTVRSRDGIYLKIGLRDATSQPVIGLKQS